MLTFVWSLICLNPYNKELGCNTVKNHVNILALYEKIPMFCFNCGRVGHGDETCTFVNS